jgi:hypothetical protein
MSAAVVRVEHNPVCGPTNGRVMELEPRYAEHDRILAQSRYVEASGLGMRANLELERQRFVGGGAGGDGTAIGNTHEQRRVLERETDGVGSSKSGIDERGGGAGVDHGDGLDGRALDDDRHEEREVVVGGKAR